MDFLVHIVVRWPPEGDPERFKQLAAAEKQRAHELVRQGAIVNLWRVPGRRENYGIWRAADATELHAAIESLPFFPWLDVQVTPLAKHPNFPRD